MNKSQSPFSGQRSILSLFISQLFTRGAYLHRYSLRDDISIKDADTHRLDITSVVVEKLLDRLLLAGQHR